MCFHEPEASSQEPCIHPGCSICCTTQCADAVQVVAPKVNDPQESWFKPDSQESSLSHLPETTDPAISGPVKNSSSSDPPGAPTVEADLAG